MQRIRIQVQWLGSLATVALAMVLAMAFASQAQAYQVFGKATVVIDGYQGYNTTVQEGLNIRLEGIVDKTTPGGFFTINTQSLALSSTDGPVQLYGQNANKVMARFGTIKISLPVTWSGWKYGNRILLFPIRCFVDSSGGAFCKNETTDKDQVTQMYALRFGIVDLRQPAPQNSQPQFESAPSDAKPVRPTQPTQPVRPQPVRPQPVRPLPTKPKPQIKPTPEPEIIGPSD